MKKNNRSILDLLWQIFARGFLVIAGIILVLYGLDGVVGGDILPAAGRKFGEGIDFVKNPDGTPKHLKGIGARIYGAVFVILGSVIFALATGLLGWIERKLFRRRNW